MLAAASVPMGIPAIAVTQDQGLTADQAALCAADRQTAVSQGIACPAPAPVAAEPAPEPATDTSGAAQQAQAAADAQQPAAPDTPPAVVDEGPKPVDGDEATDDAPVVQEDDEDTPKAKKRKRQRSSGSEHRAHGDRKHEDRKPSGSSHSHGGNTNTGGTSTAHPAPIRTRGGAPTRANPSFFDALPGPSSSTTSVPNFVIRKFRVPVFLLPIYQAAGIEYGVRWEYLAAINEIETDYGRNLNVSSAGALGWMQFMPQTWKAYGVDANKDGKKDPFNPVDAIFASARYLKAAGAPKDMRKAIFAYNHADWYVDSVVLRAKLIAGIPPNLVGSLTGLTEGRFPVAARARYADDLSEKDAKRRVKNGQNAANVVGSDDSRRGIDIFAKEGSAVVAVSDGVRSRRSARTGSATASSSSRTPTATATPTATWARSPSTTPSRRTTRSRASARPRRTNDPKPTAPASAGRQVEDDDAAAKSAKKKGAPKQAAQRRLVPVVKKRLFAHPDRPNARKHGGEEQMFEAGAQSGGEWETYKAYFARGFGLNSKNAQLKKLKKGSHVVASTVLGRVGTPTKGEASHVRFEIRPAGRGAPSIDPKPILDGWKLLESTAIYRASGKNVLHGDDSDGFSIGQILLLPKPMLEKRVLEDNRIEIYPGGRNDIKNGQIDRRVLALLEYLAEVGLRPTVSSASSRATATTPRRATSRSTRWARPSTSRGSTASRSSATRSRGGITEQAVRRIMQLQGTMTPAQVISLLDLGGPTLAMGDHDDHIHVGFRPLFGENKKLGQQAMAVLKPGQWNDLIDRLGQIENPVVPTKPSKFAIPAPALGGSDAPPRRVRGDPLMH